MTAKRVIIAKPDDEFGRQVAALLGKLVGNTPADSTASDVAGIVADFNALLAVLRGLDGK
jgi:hypothetical protein